jgi:hypothetical protein
MLQHVLDIRVPQLEHHLGRHPTLGLAQGA